MEVILLQDLYKHGVAGQVVKVADGFARNYLLPQGMAVKATKGNVRAHSHLMKQVETRQAAYDNKLNELARQIDGTELVFGRLAAPTGKLFGSVTTQEIAAALEEATGVDINRRRISQQSIREIGTFDVPVRLGNEISPTLKVIVVREEEYTDFMAAREAGENPEVEEAAIAEVVIVEEVIEEVVETEDDTEIVAAADE